ncbi:MAG: AAA family ATPase [Thermoanaerobaculaceae bacterium]|jgi:type II secretory pathway predicted ATPase ExeA|nr:AAA family ATPase [Thermoanaerobaculaceae bacterium]
MKRSEKAQLQTAPSAADAPNSATFPYQDYVKARTHLEAAMKQGPFWGVVKGPSGTGKTSLVRDLSASMDRHQHQILYLSSPRVSLLSVARYFAQVLHVPPRRSSLETIKVIAEFLERQPAHLLAWIDEATSVPLDTLSELRSLAEFNHEVPQIFSIVLSGTPELSAKLDSPALFPLKRRITLRVTLAGLRRDELDAFLVHRFGAADQRRMPLGLRDELFERTRAIPALCDRVVEHALRCAGKGIISEEHLREALDVSGL